MKKVLTFKLLILKCYQYFYNIFMVLCDHFLKISHLVPLNSLDYYSPVCQSRIGEYIKLSVCPRAFLHDGWLDFLHIGYHRQISQAAHAFKIEFGSNWSHYGYIFINFECCDISEKNVVICAWLSANMQHLCLLHV